ncbi:GTPase [Streptomyces stramineus]
MLRPRLDALRELVGLSRARLDRRTLAEAGRVLEEAAARQRHSLDLTVVAIAGATGSGKSTLFNALARTQLSEAGVRRPTTAIPIACAWTDRSDRADGLLDRLGIPARARRAPVRPYDPGLNGLVLLDLPDHDSATPGHREQVDRLLRLVDAVIWVVDPEKYADAVLHERYLRPLAGYAEVTFVVLNQVDRLSGDAADQVLDDLRRLLDEDGIALGEHGEPGATVLALSALTGDRVGELREMLAQFTAGRNVPERRLVADVDGVSARLRPAYIAKGRPGLTETARQEFEDRLAEAVGAHAAGLAAERAWLRDAERACGTSWTQARRWYGRKRGPGAGPAGTARPASGPWPGLLPPPSPCPRPTARPPPPTRPAPVSRPAGRRPGRWWSRPCGHWPTRRPPGCPTRGHRRSARRPAGARRGWPRPWTRPPPRRPPRRPGGGDERAHVRAAHGSREGRRRRENGEDRHIREGREGRERREERGGRGRGSGRDRRGRREAGGKPHRCRGAGRRGPGHRTRRAAARAAHRGGADARWRGPAPGEAPVVGGGRDEPGSAVTAAIAGCGMAGGRADRGIRSGVVGSRAGAGGQRGRRSGARVVLPGGGAGRRGGTGWRRSGGCGAWPRGAGGSGCWSRWRRSCCATGRCGPSL